MVSSPESHYKAYNGVDRLKHGGQTQTEKGVYTTKSSLQTLNESSCSPGWNVKIDRETVTDKLREKTSGA